MQATIIVGAGYGDEGKGLATDWVCGQLLQQGLEPIVVRANGGTQAAHTVQAPTGQRHVFHHHGSGSLLGVPTYLSGHFLVNPIGWRMEREELPQLVGCTMYCADAAQLTLPVDMMLNQLMEERRGNTKHGSCGWGIGETVQRGTLGLGLTVGQLRQQLQTGKVGVTELYHTTTDYLRLRLPELDLLEADLPADWRARLHDGRVLEHWLSDAEQFCAAVQPLNAADLDLVANALVFEGAQGLGLDQAGKHFPHVTRSSTGSTNPLQVLQQVGDQGKRTRVGAVTALYVTRAYATRHGAGPLEHEGQPHGCAVDDPTNVPNQWQDSLRSAPLDLELTAHRIGADLLQVLRQHPRTRVQLLMTCVDQAGPQYAYHSSTGHPADHESSPEFVQGRIISEVCTYCLLRAADTHGMAMLVSRGPTREHVTVAVEDEESHSTRMAALVRRLVAGAAA